jgi:hypothetical protein
MSGIAGTGGAVGPSDMDAAWRRIMRDVSKDSAGFENLRQFIAACRVRNDTGHMKAASDWLKRTLMLEERMRSRLRRL